MNTDRPVLILAGGAGTRLRSAVPDLPKPLAPVRGRPFLEHLLGSLMDQGANDFILSLHHQAELILDFASSTPLASKARIRTVIEPRPLGTGGAIRHVIQTLGLHGRFDVCNGDTFLSAGLRQMRQLEAQAGRPGSDANNACDAIGLVRVPDASRYGRVYFDASDFITRFAEKQSEAEQSHHQNQHKYQNQHKHQNQNPHDVSEAGIWINCGLYALNSQTVLSLDQDVFSIERDLFPQLVANKALRAHRLQTDFIDIGIPEDYQRFCDQMTFSPRSESHA